MRVCDKRFVEHWYSIASVVRKYEMDAVVSSPLSKQTTQNLGLMPQPWKVSYVNVTPQLSFTINRNLLTISFWFHLLVFQAAKLV